MTDLIQHIRPELLILAVALYIAGVMLKNSKLKDNFIPIVLIGLGIVGATTYCCILDGFTFATICVGIVQGWLCAAASNNVNQVIKQMRKLGDDNASLAEAAVKYVDKGEEDTPSETVYDSDN